MDLQIKRYILPNNYSVGKYNPLVSPLCTFCTHSMEEIPHLFWGCVKVNRIWQHLRSILEDLGLESNITKALALFGDIKFNGAGWKNTLLILTRYFIWRKKFFKENLEVISYRAYIRSELQTIKQILDTKHGEADSEWSSIFAEFDLF